MEKIVLFKSKLGTIGEKCLKNKSINSKEGRNKEGSAKEWRIQRKRKRGSERKREEVRAVAHFPK